MIIEIIFTLIALGFLAIIGYIVYIAVKGSNSQNNNTVLDCSGGSSSWVKQNCVTDASGNFTGMALQTCGTLSRTIADFSCANSSSSFGNCTSNTGCNYNFKSFPLGMTNLTTFSAQSSGVCLNSISGIYNIGWYNTPNNKCYLATQNPQFTSIDSSMGSDPNFTMWIKSSTPLSSPLKQYNEETLVYNRQDNKWTEYSDYLSGYDLENPIKNIDVEQCEEFCKENPSCDFINYKKSEKQCSLKKGHI